MPNNMFFDLFLIAQAEALSNGRYIHRVADLVAAYRAAYNFALDSGLKYDIDTFNLAQQDLRKFVSERRAEKIQPDEYDLDVLMND